MATSINLKDYKGLTIEGDNFKFDPTKYGLSQRKGEGNLIQGSYGELPELGFGSWLGDNAGKILKMAGSVVSAIPLVGQIAGPVLIGAGAAMLTGLKMAGIGDVELDPRSSDFGKLKIKGTDTRLDVWTGYSQWLRFFAQVTGAEKKTASGNIEPLSRDEVVFRMMQSKASPAAGLLVDILRGEDFMGRKLFTDTTGALDQVGNRLLPLFIQDLYDAIEQEGLL
ncbi:hypothetical protein LCGC14_1299870, partial [marine sediment metagenome]